jgi:hypothetical protein
VLQAYLLCAGPCIVQFPAADNSSCAITGMHPGMHFACSIQHEPCVYPCRLHSWSHNQHPESKPLPLCPQALTVRTAAAGHATTRLLLEQQSQTAWTPSRKSSSAGPLLQVRGWVMPQLHSCWMQAGTPPILSSEDKLVPVDGWSVHLVVRMSWQLECSSALTVSSSLQPTPRAQLLACLSPPPHSV